MTLTEDAAKVSGIAYVMDAYRDAAEAVLETGEFWIVGLRLRVRGHGAGAILLMRFRGYGSRTIPAPTPEIRTKK